VAYNDLVTDVASFTTQASAASVDLAGVVAGADVLATQFDSLKSTVDSLSIALNELTGGQYTVLKDTAAARPVTPSTGQLFFASDTKAFSLYGGSWGAVCPTGIVSPFAGASAPEGWFLCDGLTTHSTSTYAALFALIAYTYGGSGGTFGVPNLKGRTVIGVGAGTELTATLGTYQGAATLPAHTHPVAAWATTDNAGSHRHGLRVSQVTTGSVYDGNDPIVRTTGGLQDGNFDHPVGFAGSHNHTIPATTTDPTGTGTHGVVQPSMPLTYIIKV